MIIGVVRRLFNDAMMITLLRVALGVVGGDVGATVARVVRHVTFYSRISYSTLRVGHRCGTHHDFTMFINVVAIYGQFSVILNFTLIIDVSGHGPTNFLDGDIGFHLGLYFFLQNGRFNVVARFYLSHHGGGRQDARGRGRYHGRYKGSFYGVRRGGGEPPGGPDTVDTTTVVTTGTEDFPTRMKDSP